MIVETRIIDYAALRKDHQSWRLKHHLPFLRRWAAFAAAFLLSACATVQLGTVHAPAGTTAEQRDLAVLVCKDEAREAIEARAIGDFAAGFTLVGAPIAIRLDNAKQRAVFGACMTKKGYGVTEGKRGIAE